jgi:mannose-1-phosphate guanylyltransferase
MARRKFSDNVFAVILVGGKGKRLRPLSTDVRPKAFLSITRDHKTMFEKTAERISKIIPPSNIVVVANAKHANIVKKSFKGLKKENLLLEPVSRNTAPAVAFASSVLAERYGDPVLVVLPADHYITRIPKYIHALNCGITFAEKNDAIVAMGIEPEFPSTEYGYVRIHGGAGKERAHKVEKFTEKPDIKTAKDYIRSGKYLWNSGMFVFKARTMMRMMKLYSPRIYKIISDVSSIETSYKKFPDISLDYCIMERAHNIYCIRSGYGWEDVGSFESLKKVLRKESRRFIERNGKVLKVL